MCTLRPALNFKCPIWIHASCTAGFHDSRSATLELLQALNWASFLYNAILRSSQCILFH